MDEFIYYLAEAKYRMYHELYKFTPYAYKSEDCYSRIKYIAKYENLLEVIDMLPVTQKQELAKVEQDYFYDAPYVHESK